MVGKRTLRRVDTTARDGTARDGTASGHYGEWTLRRETVRRETLRRVYTTARDGTASVHYGERRYGEWTVRRVENTLRRVLNNPSYVSIV